MQVMATLENTVEIGGFICHTITCSGRILKLESHNYPQFQTVKTNIRLLLEAFLYSKIILLELYECL